MPGLIASHRQRFDTDANPKLEFFHSDMSAPNIFQTIRQKSRIWTGEDTAVVLTRHVLEHETFEAIFRYFRELKRSGATYFVGSNASRRQVRNKDLSDLPEGVNFRFLNFHRYPFFLPAALLFWVEDVHNEAGGKDNVPYGEIAVWRVSDLPSNFTTEEPVQATPAAQEVVKRNAKFIFDRYR
eukprot:CAMPEP_0173388342 /NCGR_PEP_ID=MMETSP1356-20130122/10677_1 /TAXON_ID=77927 ORGANISM="Hemiselmis virescens, Strain PCC157" /NCGR_SAMPLE_ID=MMETSP1356 /ASSEMBLY_ACC=CAM_ASM_000847 /LENGTH=182 /DNA_ID=CAMNT_0014345225 /DNA_START=19 /DNA_END=567 /DNA_ORIENTATION=-